ncbi:MAG TPA: OmpA family protein [Candidatus Acidoferrales bacterium]|nr:OmpA family protein [Candidatus Acidoferrales bacterium]
MSSRSKAVCLAVSLGGLMAALLAPGRLYAQAQQPAPDTQIQATQANQSSASGQSSPLYRVTVVARTTKAINYSHAKGSTPVDFKGTILMPFAKGEAQVQGKKGVVSISAKFDKLLPATQYGPQFLTYVLWAITPEGRASNLGELQLNGMKAKVDGAAAFQAFAMIVTAEPYFAVTQPSDVVVLENSVRPDTEGSVEEVDAKFDLLQRGQYSTITTGSDVARLDPRVPLSLYEARNAMQIAQAAGSEKYAGPSFQKAQQYLQQAEDSQKHKAVRKDVDMTAREAVQTAQDALSITMKRLDDERQEAERKAAEAREALAKQQAADAEKAKLEAQLEQEKAARDKAEADAARAAALAQQQEAEKAAQLAGQQQAAAEAETEKARATALAQQQEAQRMAQQAAQQQAQAEADAAKARQAAAQAEAEKGELRKQLLAQLSSILQTHDTVRGLIVNMSDVLFDTGSYTLRAAAREKLAKISGILLAYPGLKIQVEGHTDSVGGDDFNQRLSEQRAGMVRDYLVDQLVPATAVTARGFGKTKPVASNDTPEGRQQNRRVELVVSGDAIGDSVDAPAGGSQSQ